MQDQMVKTIKTPEKELLPCPHCGGTVKVEGAGWEPGPYELWSAKFRCQKCGGLYDYRWRSSAYKDIPTAVEWWNTRVETPPWTVCGYDLQQLVAVAGLLQENEITPVRLNDLFHDMAACHQIVEKQFIKNLDRQLQEMLATR